MASIYAVYNQGRDDFQTIKALHLSIEGANAAKNTEEGNNFVVEVELTGQDVAIVGEPVHLAFQAISPVEFFPDYVLKLATQNKEFFDAEFKVIVDEYQKMLETKHPEKDMLNEFECNIHGVLTLKP